MALFREAVVSTFKTTTTTKILPVSKSDWFPMLNISSASNKLPAVSLSCDEEKNESSVSPERRPQPRKIMKKAGRNNHDSALFLVILDVLDKKASRKNAK